MPWYPFLLAGLAILCVAAAVWGVSVRLRDASIVDVLWGPLFLIAAVVYHVQAAGSGVRGGVVLVLTGAWALRLGIHIFLRNRGKGEDFRYQAFRRKYGPGYWWISFFQVFVLQGALAWVISTPLLAAQAATGAFFTFLDFAGMAAWGLGMVFETAGDWQLARFKADPANKGKLMTTGLWRYTRHPNYFGDACVWWGFWLLACAAPWGWATVLSPLLMTFLLLRVSGVALLERSMNERPGYAEYSRRTSVFFPLPPRA